MLPNIPNYECKITFLNNVNVVFTQHFTIITENTIYIYVIVINNNIQDVVLINEIS